MSSGSRERGVSLLVTMIFLILMSLFAISAFNGSTGNLRIIGNMQARQQSIASAQKAIEQTLSSSNFSSNPEEVAASPVDLDIDGDGTIDYSATLSPRPACYRVKTMKTFDLNVAAAQDLPCFRSGSAQNTGIEAAGAEATSGDSMCANSEWNIRATVSDSRSGTNVAVNQGVSVRILSTDASNSCK